MGGWEGVIQKLYIYIKTRKQKNFKIERISGHIGGIGRSSLGGGGFYIYHSEHSIGFGYMAGG